MNELLRRLLFLPEQASAFASDLDALHYVVVGATLLGALGVALTAITYLLRYRAGRAEADRGRRLPPSIPTRVEVSVVAGLALLFTAFWVVGFRQFVRAQTAPDDAMVIYGTAKQWMWAFAYPDGSGSKGVLYVPRGRPVKLLLTSRDVIHSFYVPAFRVKQDVIPGRMTSTWFTARNIGRYDLLCAEYGGLDHSLMRATVVVQPEQVFVQGRAGRARPEGSANMVTAGRRAAAERGCLRCHTLDGTPHVGPTWAGLYGSEVPLAAGRTVIADEAYLTASMMDPMRDIHEGFAPVMPSYQGALPAAEVGAIVELIRSLRDVSPASATAPLPVGPMPDVPEKKRGPFEQEQRP